MADLNASASASANANVGTDGVDANLDAQASASANMGTDGVSANLDAQQLPTRLAELYATFSFKVEIGKVEAAVFDECTLPSLEVETTEQKEGGYTTGVHILPGPVKAGRLTLKRGVIKSNELMKWYLDVAAGKLKDVRRHVTVILLDSHLKPVITLHFNHAFPVKWSGPTFKTSDSSAAIETLELAFAEFSVDKS